MQQVRVLHVINRNQRRGAETVAWELAAELDRLGLRNDLVALGGAASGPALGPIPQLISGPDIGGLRTLALAARLRRRIKASAVDVVLAHGGDAAQVSVLATARLGVPVVWHRILELPGALHPLRRLPLALTARRVAGVVAITDLLVGEVRRLGYAGEVLRVPNARVAARFVGLDRAGCRAALRTSLGIPADRVVLGFVGHLVGQKRPERAIDVLDRMSGLGHPAELVMVGDGPLRGDLEALVRDRGLQDRVHLLGHRADVPELLAAFDLLLLTSESESMTGTSIESLMAGCPIAAFALDGLQDVVVDGSTGVMVEQQDTALMAEAVSQLVTGGRLPLLAESARAHGVQFAMETVAPRYAGYLTGIAGGASAAKPLRVLYLMPDFGVGGAERALSIIAERADAATMRPLFATLRPPRRPVGETIIPTLERLGHDVHVLATHGRADRSPLALLRMAWALRRLCRRLDVDVVDSCLFEADLVTRAALVGTSVRHVVHLVNTPYDDAAAEHVHGRGSWRRAVVRWADARSAPLTDSFVAITRAVGDAAERDLGIPARRITVISRGVDVGRFAAQAPPASGPLRLLAVGRLVPQKGHRYLVDAVRLARAAGVDVTLTIAGEGPLRAALEQQVRAAGLDAAVHLAAPTTDVVGLHRSHDVFAFVSLWEGQGNALLEAMACARPVIASDIAPMREVLEDAAFYARAGDSADLGARIAEVAALRPAERARAGQTMRERVCGLYDAADRVRELEEHYVGLLRSD